MALIMRILVIIGISGWSYGCSFDFESRSEITDRRILAIQVEPPELTGMLPLTASVQINALVVDPDEPAGTAAYAWWYCITGAIADSPFGNGGGGGGGPGGGGPGGGNQESIRCPDGEGTVLIDSGNKAINTLTWTLTVPNDILAVLSAGGNAPAPQFDLQLRVNSKSGDLFGVKNIGVSPVLPLMQAANTNPQLTGLQLDGVDWLSGTTLTVSYGECSEDQRENKFNSSEYYCLREIVPVFEAQEAQFYKDRNPFTGTTEDQRERLRFAWFTDSGSFSDAITFQPDPRFDFPYNEGVATKWREPEQQSEDTTVTIWVIVRDGRGGLSWQMRQLILAMGAK